MDENKKMKWQKDFDTFFPIYNSFIFEGYIDDDQPYEDENGVVDYCRLYDYFDKVYSNHSDKAKRKRVIIYDPTESAEKRFRICDDNCEMVEEYTDDDSEPTSRMVYSESDLSQHFWDIIHNDDINKLLIDHKDDGPSLDFSRIHYALTEGSGRIEGYEIIEQFAAIFQTLFGDERKESEPSGYMFVIKMTSRLLSRDGQSGNSLSSEELMIFRQLLNIAQSIDSEKYGEDIQQNKLIILANQIKDLPSWFTDEVANPFIKIITVAHPSEENKLAFLHEMLDDPSCFSQEFMRKYREMTSSAEENGSQTKRNPVEKKFLAYTNDFSMNMLRRYRVYASNNPVDDPRKLGFSISSFRLGDMTNPWDDEERIKEMLNIKDTVRKKIQGQDEALGMAQDILTRAAIGLDRAKNPNAPRVVLFLAGPTGTGKTELCKQIAEFIFGSEDRIVRFDMSEYGQEESDQKLFGAPPGYVGYEEGGKLTNAIKKEPFSLILFDEIEKAHNSILDKFLQILGDGRLTDGKGETVRFTDCIIVITSNAGISSYVGKTLNGEILTQDKINEIMSDQMPDGDMDIKRVAEMEKENIPPSEIYAKVREHLRYNVKAYFYCQLGRPELYGRIEDSIVYYNYIGKESVATIVSSTIDDAIKSAKESMGIKDFNAEDMAVIKSRISEYCQDCKVRALGARGIIKSTEKLFTGSLSSNLLSDYIRNIDGKKRADLVGATLYCECSDHVAEISDFKWRAVNG